MSAALHSFWAETLKSDLIGFADPRTQVTVETNGATISAVWTQRGHERTATFRLSPDGDFRRIPPDGGEPSTYREFLCSEDLADFDQLSEAIIRSFPARQNYVSTKGSAGEGEAPESQPSHELLLTKSNAALEDPSGKTQLLFLKGDAGAGKTTLLHEVTRQQAEAFKTGDSRCLFLYVSAQGRALSNLRDALSGELDDLRAGFTRDAVPPLVRQGLLVPIIDGFDELLGAAGYGDAFGSLHQFLDQLLGLGTLIVSARSSFYDVEFVGRELIEGTKSSAYDIVPVTLDPWGDAEVFQYLAGARGLDLISDGDRQAVAELGASDRELLAKPFFASLFPQYVDSPEGRASGVSLPEYLVESYVGRESEKIVDRDGRPLLDAPGHRQIFLLTAEFMWTGEKRDFSADDLRTVAELAAEEVGLAGDSARQLVTKITSYAGFRTSREGREQRFQFEHEVYFDHFLSEALRGRMDDAARLGLFLDGGLLPAEVINTVVDEENGLRWLDLLDGFRRAGAVHENRRRNAGTLAAACFRSARKITGRTLEFCQFVNTSFGDAVFEDVEFKQCRFVAVDLGSSRFRRCYASGCVAESLLVSQGGEIDIKGLLPGNNLYCVVDLSKREEIFSPGEMRNVLHGAGMLEMAPDALPTLYSTKAERLISLLQRIAQKYRQSNLLCLEDDRLLGLFRNQDWPELHKLLVEHQIVAEEIRQTSGSKKSFLRYQVSLTELMRLERDPNLPMGTLGDFWRSLRAD